VESAVKYMQMFLSPVVYVALSLQWM